MFRRIVPTRFGWVACVALIAVFSAPMVRRAAQESHAAGPAQGPSPIGSLPATFAGVLPCADCSGIRYRIDLLPGGAYVQRMTYLRSGRDESFYELGAWALSSDGRALTLDGGRGKAWWGVENSRQLRKLDVHGKPIESKLPYELIRGPAPGPLEPRGTFSGMFRYLADAARFRECRSGLEWPVAMSGDYRALERAYSAGRATPGAELMVSLEGRIESRAGMEAGGAEPTLVVEKFLRVVGGQTCVGGSSIGLEDSRWRLARVGELTVTASEPQREPWIVLESRAKRMEGSGGCNRLSGGYDLGQGTLRFGPVASTRMACPSIEVETAFLRALEATRRFRVTGRSLELIDQRGAPLARLEEANLK